MTDSDSIVRLSYEGRELILVGTAHISRKSVEQVRQVIESERPDVVCVELDEMRYRALTDEAYWRKLDIFTVIRQQRVLFLLVNMALSAFQRRMGKKLGVRPGEELLEAVHAASSVGARLVLADRDIQATLKRTWASLGWWKKTQVTGLLLAAPFSNEELTEEKVESLKDRDDLSEMLGELAQEIPEIKVPLIDERDQFLISSVRETEGQKVVAVVGAGHVPGMVASLHMAVDRERLAQLPKPGWLGKALGWGLPLLILGLFFVGAKSHPQGTSLKMVLAWVLSTSLLTALSAILVRAKPLTVLLGALAAPITTLHPAISAGMVTGLAEAWLRKPTVEDCERISEDITSWKTAFENRFTRVLIVSMVTNLGAALGFWIGSAWLVKILAGH